MDFTQTPITFILLAATVGISMLAFNNKELLNKLIFNPFQANEYNEKWRFLTHGFIHGSMMHLAVNMYVFYNFGRIVEGELIATMGQIKGEVLFLVLYIGAILFAPLSAYKKHKDNPGYNSLGASGATSAVLIVFIIMFPSWKLSLILLPIPMPAIVFGILFFAYESYMNKKGGTGVAHDAHLLGAMFGLGFLALINIRYFYNTFDYIMSFIS